jgi:UDP-N-acetylglucosamine acyltransferase
MSADIHPTAIIDSSAELGADVIIGPFCIIGPNVKIGARTRLVAHVFIERETSLGEDNVVHPYATLGQPAQDTSYKAEPTTLEVGAHNTIREHVSMHRGTVRGKGKTIVGDNGYFMAQSHVAHDCVVGDNVIFAQGATLGGHVQVGNHVIMGGLSAMHQNGRIGHHAFIGGLAAVVADVIPYGSVFGNHAQLAGLNVVGLKRRGFTREAVHDLRAAYRLLFAEEGTFQERVDDVAELYAHVAEVREIVSFIRADAQRPLCMPKI